MAANIPMHFSTSGIRGLPCVAVWQDFMETVYYPLESKPNDPSQFLGEVSAVSTSSMTISRYVVDALKSTRRPAGDEDENFILFFPVRQRQRFSQQGVDRVALPGELIALNASEPYQTEMPDKSDCIALKIPSAMLRRRIPAIDKVHTGQVCANRSLVPIIGKLAAEMLRLASSLDAAIIERAGLQIIDLLSLAFEVDGGAGEPTTDTHVDARLHLLDRFLAANFRDPELSVADAAKAAGISVRYIHRLMQLRGTTFGQALMFQRLSEGHRLLCDPFRKDGANETIADIAYACGFSSQSHFAYRYKLEFGHTPRDMRSEHRRLM